MMLGVITRASLQMVQTLINTWWTLFVSRFLAFGSCSDHNGPVHYECSSSTDYQCELLKRMIDTNRQLGVLVCWLSFTILFLVTTTLLTNDIAVLRATRPSFQVLQST